MTPDSKSPIDANARVLIGRLGRAHGLKGDLLLEGCSLSDHELRALGDVTWRGPRGAERPLRISAAKAFMAKLQVRFAGITSREAAAELSNGELWVERSRLPEAGGGQVYTFQLVGLRVETLEGRVLGTLADVMPSGAHPIYVVRDGAREFLIPAVEPFVEQVDLEAGVIRVNPPAGFDEL